MSMFPILFLLPVVLSCLFLLLYIVIPYLRVFSYKSDKDAVTYFFPIIGCYRTLFKDAEKNDSMYSSKVFAREHPGKKVVVTNFSNKLVFVLHDAQYIRESLKRPDLYELSELRKIGRYLMGEGLLFAQDAKWKRQRKTVSSCFHYGFLKSVVPLVQKITREFLNKIDSKNFKNCPAIDEVQKITSEVTGRIFFGERLNDYTFRGKPLTTSLAELISEVMCFARTPAAVFLGSSIMKMTFIPQVAELTNKINEFRDCCKKIIANKSIFRTDDSNLISVLLRAQKSAESNEMFDDTEIVDIFITLFVGGMDTTGHLIGMTLYMLTQHPQYLEELQAERDQAYNRQENVTNETLQSMDSLHNVLKETLRMYTPAPLIASNVAREDLKIGDLTIPKGTLVEPRIIAPQFDDKCVQNPDKFDPSRWTRDEGRTLDQAFVSFSAGPKNCIGQHLAMLEAKVIVSEFCEKFDFKVEEGFELKMTVRFLYEPVDDIRLRLTPRK